MWYLYLNYIARFLVLSFSIFWSANGGAPVWYAVPADDDAGEKRAPVARRFQEVGIRKANGASIGKIIVLLNTELLKWVLLAFVVACPAAFFVMRRWLQDFAYRTEISWWIFVLAGLAAILISILTITLQIYRVARQNPVNALRYE